MWPIIIAILGAGVLGYILCNYLEKKEAKISPAVRKENPETQPVETQSAKDNAGGYDYPYWRDGIY